METENQDPVQQELPEVTDPVIEENQEDIHGVLKDIRDKLDDKEPPKAPPAPVAVDEREKWKKEFGFDDKQVDGAQRIALDTFTKYQSAEKTMWSELTKKFPDIVNFRGSIEEELGASDYTPAHRINPVLVEKVYWMTKGKSVTPKDNNAPTNQPPAKQTPGVVSRKISSGYPERDSSPGKGSQGQNANLSDDEKQVVDILENVSPEDYAASKNSRRFIKPFEPKAQGIPQNANPADLALHNMSRRRGRL